MKKQTSILNSLSVVLSTALIALLIYSTWTQIKEGYLQNDPVLKDVVGELEKLHPKVSNLDFYEGNKSFTIDKQRVYLCLKDRKGDYYTKNTLMYVAIHELAHSICDEVGHTQKFQNIFDELLQIASEKGIYNPNLSIPKDYCS